MTHSSSTETGTDRPPSVGDNVISMIGGTPMVAVSRFDTGPCQLFLKLENQNPGGSIKDRIGLSMINAAERDGQLQAGGTIVEATAGNTGLGLALIAAQKGYRLILVVPDKMSQEKIFHLKALGAEVHLTRSDVEKGHPDYYQDVAARLAADIPGAFWVNQFGNPANPAAHEQGTGPEIWSQMSGDLDAIICGVGSGGTLTGLGRYFRQVAPHVAFILADPEGSILAERVNHGTADGAVGSWLVEGIGEDFVPPICDLSLATQAYPITDQESFAAARALLREEGILGGSSTGTQLAAALKYCRAQTRPKRVVTFVCDSGNKYLSKMFNDYWMMDRGFSDRPSANDLSDLVARRHADRATVTVKSTDNLSFALGQMQLYDISQLPVMDGDKIVGILDETDILLSVQSASDAFAQPVSTAMTARLETLQATENIAALTDVFGRGHVAIIMREEHFIGLVTPVDLLNHLRRQQS